MMKIHTYIPAGIIFLLMLSFSGQAVAQTLLPCDTIRNFSLSDTLTIYTVQGGGYVSGHNNYGDIAKAEKFTHPFGTQREISTIYIQFGYATASAGNETFDVKVWSADGAAGEPGTLLHTQQVEYKDAAADAAAETLTVINLLQPLMVPSEFFVGVEFGYNPGDTVAIATTTDSGDTISQSTGWEKWSDNAWYSYDDSWELNLSHAIGFLFIPECEDLNVTSTTLPSTGSNGSVMLNTVCGTHPIQYSWGISASTQILTGLAPGTYTVTVSDAVGCSVVHSAVVESNVGVAEYNFQSIKISPNPTNGMVTIDAPIAINDAVIEIRDVVGKKLLSKTYSDIESNKMDLSEFSNGIYFIIISKEEKRMIRKILLNK